MGVYYTCSNCGKTEKGSWPCDCPTVETNNNIMLKLGCKILNARVSSNGINQYLLEKLQTPSNEIIYMSTCLGGGDGEYEDQWKVVLIDEEKFNLNIKINGECEN